MGFDVHVTIKRHGETKKVFARQFPGTINGASKANKYARLVINNTDVINSTVTVTRRITKRAA